MSASRRLRVLVAPQEFKGTLTALEAAEALERGLSAARPAWTTSTLPLADGGPGTVELVLSRVAGAHRRRTQVSDPLGRPVEATWAVLPRGDVAVLEMAQASGLSLVSSTDRRALDASTFGTGQLVLAALDAGCRHVIVGAGGSATTDGGAGALAALGVRFLDARGVPLVPSPRHLARCAAIDWALDPRLAHTQLEVWTDVRNPLLGPTGTSRLYARQKGASGWDVVFLERTLRTLAALAPDDGLAKAERAGSGAAGGLAWGLEAFCGATLQPGFLSLAALVRLDEALSQADLVVTGEGQLDAQTAWDKGPWGLAHLAKQRGCRVVAFVGRSQLRPDEWRERFDAVVQVGAPSDAPALRLEACARAWAEAEGGAR